MDIAALRAAQPPILLQDPAERDLALELVQLGDAIDKMLEDYRPNILTAYLFSLATKFSRFYQNCDVLKAEIGGAARQPPAAVRPDRPHDPARTGIVGNRCGGQDVNGRPARPGEARVGQTWSLQPVREDACNAGTRKANESSWLEQQCSAVTPLRSWLRRLCLAERRSTRVVTSPPYFRQRDYSGDAQVGHEDTPDRIRPATGDDLRPVPSRAETDSGTLCGWCWATSTARGQQLGMPWRVALALVDFGWILRSDIIWHKPNAMPSAVKTRPTTDHEYVFLPDQVERSTTTMRTRSANRM